MQKYKINDAKQQFFCSGSQCSLRIRRYVAAGPPPRRRCFESTPATVLSAGMDTPS